MIIRPLAITLLVTGFINGSAGALAQEQSVNTSANQWVTQRIVKTYGRGFSDKKRAKKEYGEIVFTSSTTEPGIYFSCLDKKFRVGLVYEAQSMNDAFRAIKISGVTGDGKLVPTQNSLAHVSAQFDGQEKTRLGKWLYFEDNSATLSRDNKAAQKLYNAVVRGQRIDVTIRSTNHVTLGVPKVSSTFADFGAECGIGRKR